MFFDCVFCVWFVVMLVRLFICLLARLLACLFVGWFVCSRV